MVEFVITFGVCELLAPLRWSYFDAEKEWITDTPLESQIVLEAFINRETLRKSPAPGKYIKMKVHHFYAIYEILCNITNRKCHTIAQ